MKCTPTLFRGQRRRGMPYSERIQEHAKLAEEPKPNPETPETPAAPPAVTTSRPSWFLRCVRWLWAVIRFKKEKV